MSAIMHHAYLDFFSIAVDAYKNKNISIYHKLMITLISNYKSITHEIELSSIALDTEEILSFSDVELEIFYEEMYDAVDVIKIYQLKFETLNSDDSFLKELYEVLKTLHLVIIENIDRVSTLEVKSIQDKTLNHSNDN